ncbi:peptidoglycan-binding protein [Streptomyces sp. ISL-94]|uniref:peptidoglycan-binding domain-containing protein n=1 Tax=Streptomyces sp. ISL-94 TaxID=2819190 RepID=UPI001BEC97A2|nr:peptidoglycan-binding domain-containing protein [Streptomyces sp. ISL-94]MBT2480593.1 peptidoglycan-binding protein [Streptomyces sp. ISL-94]
MSHDSDESGIVPDDRLFIRPYVAPSGRPHQETATGPAWPQSGPVAYPGPPPDREPPRAAGHRAAAAAAGAGAGAGDLGRPARGRGRRRISPAAVVVLTVLAAAGVLVFLLNGSDPQPPPRNERPPDLSVPALPARSPDGATSAPAAARSAAPGSSAASGPAASQSAKPTPSPSASTARPTPGAGGTLRPGDRGPEVSDLQARLFGQGFTYVSVTGVYDGQTRRGVAQLQSDRGITGDPKGVYGPATRAAFG